MPVEMGTVGRKLQFCAKNRRALLLNGSIRKNDGLGSARMADKLD